MVNLKLFTSMQGDNSASLLLRPGNPGMLEYFLISGSVNYDIVASGQCAGELPGDDSIMFDITLSSVVPLLYKSHAFKMSYIGGELRFVEASDKFTIKPLCVEHNLESSLETIRKFLDVTNRLQQYEEASTVVEELSQRAKSLRTRAAEVAVEASSGWVNSTMPWGDPEETVDAVSRVSSLELEAAEVEKQKEREEEKLRGVQRVDLSGLRRISDIAAKYNQTVSMCEDYALVQLSDTYLFQKIPCGVRVLQGKLLHRLLMEPFGQFYEIDGELVFTATAGKGVERSNTYIFPKKYMPNTTADSTLITKGAVLERYQLKIKGMLPTISSILSKFDTMTFDMGSATLLLENDRGEQFCHKFEMEDAKTLELNKLMRGEAAGEIVMSAVTIPPAVQRILAQFHEDFTVYVKSRKIIIQSGDLYAVFGR